MQIPDKFKMNIGQDEYIRGYKILELIAKSIEEDGVGTKGIYLQTSRKYFDSINECDKVKLLRLEYDTSVKEQRKKLKHKRKKKYQIKLDELTGEVLKKDFEFSHIRSVSMYKSICDNIDNGLLINKSVHKIITEKGINDENELKSLCEEYGWSTSWYKPYVDKFNAISW